MGIALPEFTPAQESLFLTLGSRALDSRLPHPFLGDVMADEIITTIGYGLDKFPQLNTKFLDRRSKVFDVAVRAKILDEMVRRFIVSQPDAVMLDLGAGLDGRISRVNPPPTVEWYDVDFPEVVTLRRKLLPQPANAHNIGADLTDPDWLQDIPRNRPAMIVADGLILFLGQDDFVSLLNRLTAHFPSGELALNVYTTYAMWTFKHSRAMRAIAGGMANPGINDPRLLEHWVDGLTLLDEIFLTRAPEVAELPLIGRLAFRLAARSTKLSRLMATVVLRYRF
ncbi:class I SAM-dependent methyltransferase [Mycobacterium sp. NPDC048908]|uniref:class I SAM-dependent methyltransferase n=1 Tax=Mycobacterium sp. NPDC048908 TaxID=3364292 RepID=UPI00371E1B94